MRYNLEPEKFQRRLQKSKLNVLLQTQNLDTCSYQILLALHASCNTNCTGLLRVVVVIVLNEVKLKETRVDVDCEKLACQNL